MLNDFGPQSAGASATPAPSAPWQRAQSAVKIASPRVESPVSGAIFGIPSAATRPPTGTPRERCERYATMSCISRESLG